MWKGANTDFYCAPKVLGLHFEDGGAEKNVKGLVLEYRTPTHTWPDDKLVVYLPKNLPEGSKMSWRKGNNKTPTQLFADIFEKLRKAGYQYRTETKPETVFSKQARSLGRKIQSSDCYKPIEETNFTAYSYGGSCVGYERIPFEKDKHSAIPLSHYSNILAKDSENILVPMRQPRPKHKVFANKLGAAIATPIIGPADFVYGTVLTVGILLAMSNCGP